MKTLSGIGTILALLLTGSLCARAQIGGEPRLSIEWGANQTVRLSWTNPAAPFLLEHAGFLADFSLWQEITQPAVVAGDQSIVTINPTSARHFFRLRERELTRVRQTSPADGESGVAVTRETIFRFNHALATNTFLGSEHVHADAAGRRLLSRVELSSDRKTVTLFYLELLPGSSRVHVTFNAFGLSDEFGRLVDLDGDGQPGGVAAMAFDTLSLTPVPNTAVIGTVYASQPVPGAAPGEFNNRPLAGVTITVDGREETMRAVTDANGQFRLEPCPAGEFFVHIDGRTVTDVGAGIRYPDLAYYPFVGKAWSARPGVTNHLAGETGLIYLPLVAAGTLQPVSATEDTVITFPPSVLAQNPALAGVSITVPANALFSDGGVRGGKVGLAPVPPDRLPGPLPPGLEPPIVFTVQTDGPGNFDRPVPVRFPNLPDPQTGEPLPPGAKSALVSFNHDTGLWEIQGSMTVSEDGSSVETDAGVGIRQPGWGAVVVTSGGGGGGPEGNPGGSCNPEEDACCPAAAQCALAAAEAAAMAALARELFQEIGDVRAQLSRMATLIGNLSRFSDDLAPTWIRMYPFAIRACQSTYRALIGPGVDTLSAIARAAGSLLEEADRIYSGAAIAAGKAADYAESADRAARRCDLPQAQSDLQFALAKALEVQAYLNSIQGLVPPMAALLAQALAAYDTVIDGIPGMLACLQDPPAAAFADPDHVLTPIDPSPAPSPAWPAPAPLAAVPTPGAILPPPELNLAAAGFNQANEFLPGSFTPQPERHYYLLQRIDTDATGNETVLDIQRGLSPGNGQAIRNPFLRPNTRHRVWLYSPQTQFIGRTDFATATAGTIATIPPILTTPDSSADADADGLGELAERVIGTNPALADTDGDGVGDGVEIELDSDPLDGRPASNGTTLGIIAAADTPGTAVDVCVEDDRVIVADGASGVAVFSLANGLNPLLLAQLDTPGSAHAVACSGGRAAVADGASGLAIIDLVSGGVPVLTHQLEFGAAVTHVAASGDFAFAGLADNRWARVDLRSGQVTETGLLPEPLHDLAVSGDRLYFLTARELIVYRIRNDGLQRLGASAQDFPGRLFVGDDLAYLGDPVSFTFLGRQRIVDVTDPNSQLLRAEATDPLPLIYDLADNGSGRLLTVSATAGQWGLLDYDSSDPGVIRLPDNFLPSAGEARAVAMHRGRAYVAAGSAGLEIFNFLVPDTRQQAPTVSLRLAQPETPPTQGRVFQVIAPARDDVQVREVEFYVNSVLVARDGSHPFSAWLTGPTDQPGATEVRLRARAVDMAGNAGWSTELVAPLGPLNNAPNVVRVSPSVGHRTVTEVTATFSGPLNAAAVAPGWLEVFAAGPDGQPGTQDDVAVPGDALIHDAQTFELKMPYPSGLPVGLYQARVSGQVQGASGDRLGTSYTWTFRVGNQLFWVNRQGGYWNDPQNWSEARLPEAGDDVIIDVPNRVPVVLNGLAASVRTLASHNPLDVRNASLTVGQTLDLHDSMRLIDGTLIEAQVRLHPGSGCEFVGLPVFDGVTVDGDLRLPSSGLLTVRNGFTLNGTMTVPTATVLFDGTQIVHAGTFVLPEESPAYLSITHDSIVTLGEAVVIRGRAGYIGFGHSTPGAQRFVHRGLLVADQPPLVNGSMVINGSAFKNEGTVEVVNGGLLTLSGAMRTADLGAPGRLRNQGGTLRLSGTLDNADQELVFNAQTGDWLLENLVVAGGSITIGAGGKPLPHGLEVEGVTVNGTLPMPPDAWMRVRNGLTLNGTIELDGILAFEGHQTLAAGTIVFGRAPGSIGSLGLIGDTVVTLGSAVELRGTRGSIGGAWVADGDQRFIHQGILQIQGADSAFTIIGKGFRNEGTVEVVDGAVLTIQGNTRTADLGPPGSLRNAGGVVRVTGTLDNTAQELVFSAQSGDWLLDNLVVTGGTITVGAGGTPLLINFEFDGVTVSGILPVPANAAGRVRNGLTIHGTVELGGVLQFFGDQSLVSGTVQFIGASGQMTLEGDTILTVAANAIIRGGRGRIGYPLSLPGQQRIDHFGLISADGTDSVIQINAAVFNDQGTLQELNGGVILLAP